MGHRARHGKAVPRVGRAPPRVRPLALLRRLPQARRLPRRAPGHAGLLAGGPAPPLAAHRRTAAEARGLELRRSAVVAAEARAATLHPLPAGRRPEPEPRSAT